MPTYAPVRPSEGKPMQINLISRDNGVGLSTDVRLLRGWLDELGHTTRFMDWRSRTVRPCDVAIHLELLNPNLPRYARHNVGVFNLEWFPSAWRRWLPQFAQLWAKSREAHNVYRRLGLRNSHCTGFLGRDLLDPAVARTPTCLHLRGKSDLKGTEQVLQVWADDPCLPELTVISQQRLRVPGNVRLLSRLDDTALRHELNRHQVHVCPSVSEGWGHYIAEGLSVGAIVVTTNASPMSEHVRPEWGFLCPVQRQSRRHMATAHHVGAGDLAARVRAAVALTEQQRAHMSQLARAHYEQRNDHFRTAVRDLLTELPHAPARRAHPRTRRPARQARPQ